MAEYSVEQIEGLLHQMLQPSTEQVRLAVERLNVLLKKSLSIAPLLQLLQTHPLAEIRQLAAVLLRKRVAGHWPRLSADVKENMKSSLLRIMGADPSPPVRRSAGEVVSVVARVTLTTGQWKELMPTILQAAESSVPEHKDLALGLLCNLSESMGDILRPYFPSIYSLVAASLRDPLPKVRLAAMKAAGALVPWQTTDNDIKKFRELIPLFVEIVKYCVTNDLEDETSTCFEVFDELLEAPVPVLTPSIPALVMFVLEIGAMRNVNMGIRQTAMLFIHSVASMKARLIIKHKLIAPILAVVFPMCAEPDSAWLKYVTINNNNNNNNNNDDIDDDDHELSAHTFASQLIDYLAVNLPPVKFFPLAMEYVVKYCSIDSLHRRAAITALTVMAEGCVEFMKDNIDTVLQCALSGFNDSNKLVCEAACVAIGQFSDYLQPELIEKHELVLPHLFRGLSDPSEQVVMKCCYALEAFCENMDNEDIEKYLQPLMTKLVDILGHSNPETQELAISAISASMIAAQHSFDPYFPSFFDMMRRAMQITNPAELSVRARATECIGLAINIVGEPARPYVPEAMASAFAGLALDFPEIKEYTYGFFGNIAEVLNEAFAEYLPAAMTALCASCDSSDGIVIDGLDAEGIEADSEDEEDDDDVGVSVRTSFLDEKAAAAQAIGQIAACTSTAFLPYVDKAFQTLEPLTRYFHENVRCAALYAFQRIGLSINRCYPPPAPFVKGDLNFQLTPQSRQYVDMVMPIFIYSAESDRIAEVAMRACDCISEVAIAFGPAAIQPHMKVLEPALLDILQRRSQCQKTANIYNNDEAVEEGEDERAIEEEEEEEEDLDENEGHDFELVDTACECCIELAGAYGAAYLPYFSALLPHVLKYTKASSHHTYRTMAYGCIAEVINRMGCDISAYSFAGKLMPLVFQGLKDGAPDVQRTAAYLCGVLIQHTPSLHVASSNGDASICVPQVLTALHPLFDSNCDAPVIDNACGAVARLIRTSPNMVPLQHVLPVLLAAVPLREDREEDKTVWGCLSFLTSTNPAAVAPFAPAFLAAAAKSMEVVKEPVTNEIVLSVHALGAHMGAQLDAAAAILPHELQRILRDTIINKR